MSVTEFWTVAIVSYVICLFWCLTVWHWRH